MLFAVIGINLLHVLNNLSPFMGWPYHGPMIMYSNLSIDASNHLLLHQQGAAQAATYARILGYKSSAVRGKSATRLREFVDWTKRTNTKVNLLLLKYQISQVCRSGLDVAIELTVDLKPGGRRHYVNACSELGYGRADRLIGILSSWPPCQPTCLTYLHRWVDSGRW